MGLRASRDREPQRRLHSIPGLGFRVEGLRVEGSRALGFRVRAPISDVL